VDLLEGGSGDDSLTGGGANDTYLFDADGALGTDTLTEAAVGSGGVDRLDFSSTSSLGVQVNLGSIPVAGQLVNSNLTLKLNAINSFEQLVGGQGNDSLQGNELANLLAGQGGNDSLSGGAGNDTYAFDVDVPLGIDTDVCRDRQCRGDDRYLASGAAVRARQPVGDPGERQPVRKRDRRCAGRRDHRQRLGKHPAGRRWQ